MIVHGSVQTPIITGLSCRHAAEELHDHQERGEHRELEREAGRVGGGEAARREQPQRQHRRARARLPGDEADERDGAGGVRGERRRRRPSPRSLPRTVAHTTPSRPALTSAMPGEVDALARAEALVEDARRASDRGDEPDRHVDPEDPVPRERRRRAGRRAAGRARRRGRRSRTRCRAPGRARSAGYAAVSSVSVSGISIAPPAPWTARAAVSAPTDGASAAAAEAAENSSSASDEHAPAAEALAERGAGEDQDGEGEDVGVDDPLEAGERGVQGALDRGQRGDDDQVVEHDHEQRGAGDGEDGRGFAGERA